MQQQPRNLDSEMSESSDLSHNIFFLLKFKCIYLHYFFCNFACGATINTGLASLLVRAHKPIKLITFFQNQFTHFTPL